MVGLFWITEFLSALFSYMLICGVCTWYFTSTHDSRGSFSLIRGLFWAFRYNFGSLSLGSLLLAVVWTVRVLFEYIEKQTKGMGEGNAVGCIKGCIRCLLDCLHRFIKFLNENAYIQIALTGNNFCTSAMEALALTIKHAGSFLVTNGIGSLLAMLGKLTISIVNCLIAYMLI